MINRKIPATVALQNMRILYLNSPAKAIGRLTLGKRQVTLEALRFVSDRSGGI